MTAGPWTLTNEFRTQLLEAGFGNMSSLAVKVALVTSASNISATSTTWAGVTGEVASGDGYTTGGVSDTLAVGGTAPAATLSLGSNAAWTASGGSIVAHWAVVYVPSGHVVAYALLDATPADVTIQNTYTLTVSSGEILGVA